MPMPADIEQVERADLHAARLRVGRRVNSRRKRRQRRWLPLRRQCETYAYPPHAARPWAFEVIVGENARRRLAIPICTEPRRSGSGSPQAGRA